MITKKPAIKKSPISQPKETNQCAQLASEVLRLAFSRLEDIALLKAVSDKKTGRVRMQSALAERTLQESEYKEEWRISKEDNCLQQLLNCKLENSIQKKQFEKTARKILRVIMQLDEEPSDYELSCSEAHLIKIMNAKISPETTYFTYNDQGESTVSVPSASINFSIWKDQCSRLSKIFESCLYGDLIFPYNAISLCVAQGREHFNQELSKQSLALDETKKAKNYVKSPSKKTLPDPEWLDNMAKMLLEQNSETEKALNKFRHSFASRHQRREPSPKRYDLAYKTHRARNFEKYPPVNPYVKLPERSTPFDRLYVRPEILFDIENPYFEEDASIEQRVKIVHSCIVIQKAIHKRKQIVYGRVSVVLQRYIKVFLARIALWNTKLRTLKRVFLIERLKHWYPVLVNRWRMHKNPVVLQNYTKHAQSIIRIQKFARGYISRKSLPWKRHFYNIRKEKTRFRLYKVKKEFWTKETELHNIALDQSHKILEELVNFKLLALGTNEGTSEMSQKLQRNEIQQRTEFLHKAKIARLDCFE